MHPITSIACAISLLAATGMAQGMYGPTGGQNLFSIGGSIGSTTVDVGGTTGDVTTTSVNLQAAVGHFLTDVHEVGVQLNENYSSPDTGTDSITTGLGGYYNYNWRQNPRTWLYAGPHLGVLMVDQGGTDDTNLAFGVHVGVRHWLSESAAIYAEPRFTISEFNGGDVKTAEVIFGYQVVL